MSCLCPQKSLLLFQFRKIGMSNIKLSSANFWFLYWWLVPLHLILKWFCVVLLYVRHLLPALGMLNKLRRHILLNVWLVDRWKVILNRNIWNVLKMRSNLKSIWKVLKFCFSVLVYRKIRVTHILLIKRIFPAFLSS